MQDRVAVPNLAAFYASEDQDALMEALESVHPGTAAEFFSKLPPSEIWSLLNGLDPKRAAKIFRALEGEFQADLVTRESRENIGRLVTELPADDRADLVKAMDEDVREEVLALLARAERDDIRRLTSYEEETAGALMTTDYAALPEDISVQDALERLRLEAPDKETIYYVYLLDANRRLTGLVSLKDLILARPKTRVLGDFAHRDVISVGVNEDQEEVAHILSEYDFLAIPVVDTQQRLVGIVTFDDLMDVIEEEAEEDLYHIANVNREERVDTSTLGSVRLRWPWLVINLGTVILAALTVSLFEHSIAQLTALAVMMPIIAGMGGNAGTQTMAVVVRGIALGDLTLRNSYSVLLKEIGVGLANGAINGVLMGCVALAWYGNAWLGAIMFVSMIANLVLAGLVGAGFPLILKALGADPALASTIFITTATDIGGFVIFLGMATAFLHHLV
ncbi:MAG: magnesium transporter [Candidatus Brocadiia bacterium]